MKKTLALMLAVVMLLLLTACGKSEAVKAVELAIDSIGTVSIDSKESIEYAEKLYDILTDDEKEKVDNRTVLADAVENYDKILEEMTLEELEAIYFSLSSAYDLVEKFGTDIYESWRVGIYEKDKFQGANLNGALEFLTSNLFLDYDDVLEGACCAYSAMWGSDWNDKAEEDKQKNRDAIATGTLFYFSQNSIYTACVDTVRFAYTQNGTVDEVEDIIDEVNVRLKEVDTNAIDSDIKEYISELASVTNAFFEYCQDPIGSFDQCKITINEYRNEARSCISSIEGAL